MNLIKTLSIYRTCSRQRTVKRHHRNSISKFQIVNILLDQFLQQIICGGWGGYKEIEGQLIYQKILKTYLLGDYPHGSPVLAKALVIFCFQAIFQRYFYSKQIWKREIVCSFRAKHRFAFCLLYNVPFQGQGWQACLRSIP